MINMLATPKKLMAVVAIATLLTACQETKFSQCQRLGSAINKSSGFMEEFERDVARFGKKASLVKTSEDLQATATDYIKAIDRTVQKLDQFATQLETLSFGDSELTQLKHDYTAVTHQFSQAMTHAGTAVEVVSNAKAADLNNSLSRSQSQLIDAVNQIESLSREELRLIDGMNNYCRAQ